MSWEKSNYFIDFALKYVTRKSKNIIYQSHVLVTLFGIKILVKTIMHLSSRIFKCSNCYKPIERRLGLFQAQDDYECYADSYVKCFWGLCDVRHESKECLRAQPDGKVITMQPR
ncbi:uncharacterized protein LOC125235345 [Leguminivora glycinivorella]|uniref:uncharacterized protein LOC125235345 n=1 Tax=Leguminivora glycinivorella TaxID=1035111 RepID=UPI00200E0090|nr:uncharacterized protein LOC125235345 [Leguminivora glycinivorella]